MADPHNADDIATRIVQGHLGRQRPPARAVGLCDNFLNVKKRLAGFYYLAVNRIIVLGRR